MDKGSKQFNGGKNILSINGTTQLEIHNEVNLPDSYLTTFYDLLKMNHKPKYEVKLKIPEGNIWGYIHDFVLGKDVLNRTGKVKLVKTDK